MIMKQNSETRDGVFNFYCNPQEFLFSKLKLGNLFQLWGYLPPFCQGAIIITEDLYCHYLGSPVFF